ncbi:hypothetical protein [Seonamhaeicola sp. ML3]|uniref:hypothetical protein n=1 Tax=Seonamhaeicola sp. ML3 TaxID=2937786 RepID=UPI00200DE121|nr:hypothetical protein [Seonamhaeicola sp. ML3]
MKVIEVNIDFEDFHYVSGILELKVSGKKINDGFNEEFDVRDVLSVKFNVLRKYNAPNIPSGIKKNRVFGLDLPEETVVYLSDDSAKGYSVKFDKIICNDKYVSENGYLRVERKNSIKDGAVIFSTLTLEGYGLIKKVRTEIQKVTFYELFDEVKGPGKILIEPKKDLYEIGEKVKITALPDKNSSFVGWDEDFERVVSNELEITIDKDYKFQANFVKLNEGSQFKNGFNDVLRNASSKKYWKNVLNPESRSGKIRDRHLHRGRSAWGGFGDLISVVFTIIGYLFYGLIVIVSVLALIKAFGLGLLYLGLVLLFFFGGSFLSSRINLLSFFRVLFNVVFFLFIGFSLFNFISGIKSGLPDVNEVRTIPDTEVEERENSTKDYVHHIKWKDYKSNEYETDLRVNSDFVAYEQNLKQTLPGMRSEADYSLILKRLNQASNESLYHVVNSLDSIRVRNNISRYDFPMVMVSMVQSIPYYAILDDSCNPYDYRDQSMRELLLNNPCQGYVKFGIKSPSEFLKDIKGDCDTRTLFLYSLLKQFGYDVAIFGSEVYQHSVLGISFGKIDRDLGVFKKYGQKKYYLWETTSMGFKVGKIPKEISDVRYWNMNLN